MYAIQAAVTPVDGLLNEKTYFSVSSAQVGLAVSVDVMLEGDDRQKKSRIACGFAIVLNLSKG